MGYKIPLMKPATIGIKLSLAARQMQLNPQGNLIPLLTKLLYVANAIGQIWFMVKMYFPLFPHIRTWQDFWAGFPLVTFCDMRIRALGKWDDDITVVFMLVYAMAT